MTYIEEILKNYPHIIQLGSWAGAISTLIIAIISVRLAYRARFSRISARVDINRLYENYGSEITKEPPYTRHLVLNITNHGPNTIFLEKYTAFSTKIPLTKYGYDTIILDFFENTKEILPNRSEVFTGPLIDEFFENYFQGIINLNQDKKNNIRLILPKLTFRYIKFYVQTSDGKFIRAKVSKNLQKHIKKASKRDYKET